MKNLNIRKINTAGLIGYIISIILIVFAITGLVLIGICTVGAFTVANDNINIKIATSINLSSGGNFLGKLNSFIGVDGIEDLGDLTNQKNIKLNDSSISEITTEENEGALDIDVKTKEISFNMNKVIIALIAAFIFLGAVIVCLYMVKALMKALKNCETPFSEEIIKKMTRFANSLVCTVILKIVLNGFWSSLTSGVSYKMSLDLGSVLLVAVIYTLIVVFKYGAKLQQESDETL